MAVGWGAGRGGSREGVSEGKPRPSPPLAGGREEAHQPFAPMSHKLIQRLCLPPCAHLRRACACGCDYFECAGAQFVLDEGVSRWRRRTGLGSAALMGGIYYCGFILLTPSASPAVVISAPLCPLLHSVALLLYLCYLPACHGVPSVTRARARTQPP